MRKQNLNKKKIILLFLFISLGAIILTNFVSAQSFSRSSVAYSQYVGIERSFGDVSFPFDSYGNFDKSLCEEGQDFILYISPLGCTHSVVRSDLLEEQNVPVFCPITATQLNPLISVETIDRISFSGQVPSEVSGIGYYPARAALGQAGLQLNQLAMNEIGYAVIVLKQQKNESAMPDFVEGNLTARISYDIKNAFGLGQATFYLPQMTDDEWNQDFKEYSFWQGRGYLRAESIGYDSAVISIYSGREDSSTSATEKKVWATTGPLAVGETSREIFMPGFDYCMGGLQLKLNSLENPDTTVRLNVNGDYLELQEGEKFLDNKCSIPRGGIEKRGIVQQATISCRDDRKGNVNLFLSINPKIILNIGGIEEEISVGSKLFETKNGEKSVYIAHITTKDDTKSEEDLIIALVELPEIKEKLSDEEIRSFDNFFNRAPKEDASGIISLFKESFKAGISSFETIERWIVSGESFRIVSYPDKITDIFGNLQKDISGKEVKIIGFADAMDSDISRLFENNEASPGFEANYGNAVSDYNDVIEGHAGETYPPEIKGETLDQQALYEKIGLMWEMRQRRTALELCEDYEERYPELAPPDVCGDAYKYSNTDIDSRSVGVNGRVYSIMIDGIREPEFNDFGAVISVRNPDGGTSSHQLIKNEIVYLETIYSYDAGPESSPIYYKYSEGWQWSPDKTYWMSVDTTKVSGGEFIGREPVQKQKDIINYLNKNKSSLQEGGKYLLETGAKKGTGGAFIQLIDIDKDPSGGDSAEIRTNIRETAEKIFIGEAVSITLKKEFPDSRGGYIFTLQQVNLQKVAKVSVVSNVNRQETEATFPFKIGIEKRAIQLSPEKTEERIESLNKTIEQWSKINDNLGNIVKAGKAACFATGTVLVVKNFFANLGGDGTARQIVMRGSGGWFEQCEKMVNSGEFAGTVEECLSEHNDEIEAAVDETTGEIEKINKIFSEEIPECKGTGGFLGEKVVNTNACLEKYLEKEKSGIEDDIQQAGLTSISVQGKDVPVSDILDNMNSENTLITQARDIELYSALLNSEDQGTREIAKAQLNNVFSDVWINANGEVERNNLARKYGAGAAATLISTHELIPIFVTETKTFSQLSGISRPVDVDGNSPVHLVKDEATGKEYVLVLDNDFVIKGTYLVGAGGVLTKEGKDESNPLGLSIKKFDSNTYKNKCPTCEVRYYQSGAYEGLPAIVPFDIEEGWYAAIKPILPLGGGQSLQPYDDSGRVTNFYLCNVGPNGREDFFRVIDFGGADDVCRLVNLGTGQAYDQFPGISSAEAQKKINDAQVAFRAASSAYNSKIRKGDFVNIMSQRIKVGDAAVGTPDIQCQDFMSPSECNILFNICDPFICPSSRCDLGGTYQVDNVIQSGVIGSMVLCLPNFPEVKVPVCVSGVYAGIDGYLNILEEYQECLQTSLDTGQQVGICDTLHSIYTCDFFWRQSLPAVKYALPELVGSILGKNVRGGGEYLNVQDSFDKASDSVNFFTQYYAADSFKAFQARSIEGVGTEVCRNWLSVPGMDAGKLFDALIAPDSPSQFLGWFDEIPYTTATVPPISHYKVFYHIYAGQDFPANYEVYLRGYSDRRLVDKGFIEAGERVQETKDFTAVSGYNELCIMVNTQEECGFKQVSTDFAVQYLSDKIAADEASRTDITTEQSCISGNPNILSLITPGAVIGASTGDTLMGASSGVEEAAPFIGNPEIYNRGITRVCATDNPGLSTDPNAGTENARWQEVGYCDTPNMKCWLDTKSVEDAIDITTLEDQALGEVEKNWIDVLKNDMNLIPNFDEFVSELENMKDEGNYTGIIKKINENFDRVFFSYEKGYLTLIRGNAFSTLAKGIFDANKKEEGEGDTGGTSSDIVADILSRGKIASKENKYPLFYFRDGRLLGGQSIYFSYSEESSKKSWYWCLTECSKSTNWHSSLDAEISGRTSGEDATSVQLVPRLSNENKDFILGKLQGSTYLEGLKALIERTKENKEKSIGIGNLRRNAKLSTEDGSTEMSHEGIFIIYGQTSLVPGTQTNSYFIYDEQDEKWLWSIGEDPREGESFEIFEGIGFYEGAAIIFSPTSQGISTSVRNKVLGAAELLDGTSAAKNSVIPDMDGNGGVNCWDSVMYVYNKAGVDTTCVYSDKKGKEYNIEEKTIQTGGMFIVNEGACSLVGLDENVKLSNIQPGDILSIAYDKDSPHNVIFIEWIDENTNKAKLFDWNGEDSDGNKIFRYFEMDLSDDKHPVYMYWAPETEGTENTGETLTCSTTTECQKALGNEIIKIAKEIKQEKGISDASVKEDTGVKNFECLILMVAMTESTIQHCSLAQQSENPLYCNSDSAKVLSGDNFVSIGVMQVNKNSHSDAFPNAYSFEGNVKWGINYLITKYNEDEKIYDCYRSRAYGSVVRESDFEKRAYSGWKRAIRDYNGWNIKCYVESESGDKLLVGNPAYVEDVLGTSKDKVVQLFPDVCGT